MKITFCIPSKNNLRYLKSSIKSIVDNSTTKHDIVVYIDADNDGTEKWLVANGIRFIKNNTNEPKGIAYAYNRCIEAATTEIVCMFHADMYMAKGFDIAILKYIDIGKVVSCTRIEPPLHPPGDEKIVVDFGLYPEDFEVDKFQNYVENITKLNAGKVTNGIFAPWAIYKSDIDSIGMHDENFHSYHEDSDIFNRFILNGYELIQTWEGYVYHLTCRGGQFQDGVDKITTDPNFHKMKIDCMRRYLRKWGSWIKNSEHMRPLLSSKYDIGFVVSNCNEQVLEVLEPWCSTIYVDCDYKNYISKEQSNTTYNLLERIKPYNDDKHNKILVMFDATKFTQNSFNIIQNLPDIIRESGEIGNFELDCFKIAIADLTTHEKNLICNIIF